MVSYPRPDTPMPRACTAPRRAAGPRRGLHPTPNGGPGRPSGCGKRGGGRMCGWQTWPVQGRRVQTAEAGALPRPLMPHTVHDTHATAFPLERSCGCLSPHPPSVLGDGEAATPSKHRGDYREPGGPSRRDASEGNGSRRRPQRRLGRRLEEVAKAVGGGNCRLPMPLRLALGVRGTVAGHRLGP